jgi:hypothetical protein
VDIVFVRASREALRAMCRAIMAEDGVATEAWDVARLDRMIGRIAAAGGDNCPGPGGIATEAARAHAEGCPRCARTLRLLREGILSPSDLFAPEGPTLPSSTEDLALILVHPEARGGQRAVLAALGDQGRRIGDGAVLARGTAVHAALASVTEQGRPAPSRLRVVRRSAPGRWAQRAVLGPAPLLLADEAAALEWGEVRGIEPLPEPLPAPPSALRWWTAAGLAATLALLAGLAALAPGRPDADVEIDAARTPAGVLFDVDDAAFVDLLRLDAGAAVPVFHSRTITDKAGLATGDGRYLWTEAGEGMIVGSLAPLDDLDAIASAARSADDLRTRIGERYPTAAVVAVR